MKSIKHLDFVFSILLLLIGFYIIWEGYNIFIDSQEVLYISPGFFPIFLGCALALCSFLLLLSSLKDGGMARRTTELRAWWRTVREDESTLRLLTGTCILALYTFILLSYLPFWLASLLFMIGLMLYLKASSLPIIVGAAVLAVGFVVVLFQIILNVPLP